MALVQGQIDWSTGQEKAHDKAMHLETFALWGHGTLESWGDGNVTTGY